MNEVISLLLNKQVDNPGEVIDRGFNGSNSSTAGCLINASKVYSMSAGTILAVEKDIQKATWTITVEIDSQCWVRYCLLSEVKVEAGQIVDKAQLLGIGYKNLMQFEYCTTEESDCPVRILEMQLYKQDPTPILLGPDDLDEEFINYEELEYDEYKEE